MAFSRQHRMSSSVATNAQFRSVRAVRRGMFMLKTIPCQGPWRLAVSVPARIIGKATERNRIRRRIIGALEGHAFRPGWAGIMTVLKKPEIGTDLAGDIRALCAESAILRV